MKVRDLGIETINALDANRGRSALTVLGIVIGIAAVIAMTALIGGIEKALMGQMGFAQAQLVDISVYTGTPLTYSDVDVFARDLAADYEYMLGSCFGSGQVTTGQKKASGMITGVKPAYFRARDTKFVQGRAFTEGEEAKGAMVIVIDEVGANKLFGRASSDVVGQSVRIDNNDYTIVGVSEGGTVVTGDDSMDITMPFRTCSTRITGNQEVTSIYGFAHEGADMDNVVERTKQYLYKKLNLVTDEDQDNVYVSSMKSMIDSATAMINSFSVLMTVVASISLLVGGIGIMNMMLTNVTERIREIGLRKALGARRSDITKQFMLESICLCLAGGLLGVLVGYAGSFALIGLGSEAMFIDESITVTPSIDLGTVLMATLICVSIGVLFGWYPARRAARLDPVESLHYQ